MVNALGNGVTESSPNDNAVCYIVYKGVFTMIRILMGPKGTGKSKTLNEMINSAVNEEKGNIVCFNMDKRYLFDLKSTVRLIVTREFNISSFDALYGFICGIIAGNYDITHIFIDNITKIVSADFEQLDKLFIKLNEISDKNNVRFTISVSANMQDATDTIKKYLVESHN